MTKNTQKTGKVRVSIDLKDMIFSRNVRFLSKNHVRSISESTGDYEKWLRRESLLRLLENLPSSER